MPSIHLFLRLSIPVVQAGRGNSPAPSTARHSACPLRLIAGAGGGKVGLKSCAAPHPPICSADMGEGRDQVFAWSPLPGKLGPGQSQSSSYKHQTTPSHRQLPAHSKVGASGLMDQVRATVQTLIRHELGLGSKSRLRYAMHEPHI